MPKSNQQDHVKNIPLNGRLITSANAATIGDNYRTLVNMYYENDRPKGIGGMTKINSTALTTNLKVRSGFHFRKEQPAESHVLVQAFNTGLTGSVIKDNTTAIPGTGNFSGANLLADAGTNIGNWSTAPNGNVVFCNKAGTYIWGGDELLVGSFINYAPDDSFKYDYSENVQNTLTTGNANLATLKRVTESVDANTMLLLHLDDNVTDSSPTTAHTVTNNNVTFTTTDKVFGTHWAVFNGTDAYLTIPDNADFDFSGGDFSIDGRINVDDLDNNQSFYYQETDATNYINCFIDTNGAVNVTVQAAGAEQLTGGFKTADSTISAGTTYYIEVTESGNDWYIFVNGNQEAYLSEVNRCANYTQVVQIGYDDAAYFDGNIDEFRVSNTPRHTGNYEIPSAAYGSATYRTYIYLGSVRPLDGFKVYVGTANTTAGTMSVDQWNGSAWAGVGSLSDGTVVAGVPFAQTGSVTFDSTVDSAVLSIIDGNPQYWYRIAVTEVDETTTISQVTVSAPFQTVKDFWNGEPENVLSFQQFADSKYTDYTTNVYEDYYESSYSNTWATLDSLLSASEYLVAGFYRRQMGLSVSFVPEEGNSTANTVVTVSYWNGEDWVSVGSVTDGTAAGGISFAESGVLSWNPPSEGSEYKLDIGVGVPLYFYKISFSQNLDASVDLYHVSGIPAQETIKAYAYPVHAGDSLWLLCEEEGYKNKMIRTEIGTENVFSSTGAETLRIGDDSELVAGSAIYMQLGSSLYEAVIVTKKHETWMIVPDATGALQKFRISAEIGCVAPGTMKTKSVGQAADKDSQRNLTLWQGADGIYMFDGKSPIPVHTDIMDYFDKKNSYSINTSKVGDSQAFFDEDGKYHFKFASGTSSILDKEFVLDTDRWRWSEIRRTAGLQIQVGIPVSDTNGNLYSYGCIDTGYLERLNNGTSFDGTAIEHILETGHLLLSDSVMDETIARNVSLLCAPTNTTTNTIACTYYKDGNTVADKTWTMEPQAANKEVANDIYNVSSEGGALFHSFKFSMSTDDETVGLEILALAITFKVTHRKKKKRY